MSNAFIDRLTPPGGTAFFKREDLMLFDCTKRPDEGELVWWVSVYKYCTGALPTDADFVTLLCKAIVQNAKPLALSLNSPCVVFLQPRTEPDQPKVGRRGALTDRYQAKLSILYLRKSNVYLPKARCFFGALRRLVKKGGAIVIVLAHHGYVYTQDNNWNFQAFAIAYDRKIARHVRTLPMAHSGTESAAKTQSHDVNLAMDLLLWKNRGHESFIFQAQLRESFVRVPDTKATGYEVDDGAVFGITKEPSVDVKYSHAPIRAVNVLKCYDPTQTLKIEFSHVTVESGKEKNRLSQSVEIKLSDF